MIAVQPSCSHNGQTTRHANAQRRHRAPPNTSCPRPKDRAATQTHAGRRERCPAHTNQSNAHPVRIDAGPRQAWRPRRPPPRCQPQSPHTPTAAPASHRHAPDRATYYAPKPGAGPNTCAQQLRLSAPPPGRHHAAMPPLSGRHTAPSAPTPHRAASARRRAPRMANCGSLPASGQRQARSQPARGGQRDTLQGGCG